MSSQAKISIIKNQQYDFPFSKKQTFVFFFLKSLVLEESLKYLLTRKFQVFSTPIIFEINNSKNIETKTVFLEPFSFVYKYRFVHFYKQRLLDFTLNKFALQQSILEMKEHLKIAEKDFSNK